MKRRATILATIDIQAYQDWYRSTIRGVWVAPKNSRVVFVSEPFRFDGENEDYREVVWLKPPVCAAVPARFITVKS